MDSFLYGYPLNCIPYLYVGNTKYEKLHSGLCYTYVPLVISLDCFGVHCLVIYTYLPLFVFVKKILMMNLKLVFDSRLVH